MKKTPIIIISSVVVVVAGAVIAAVVLSRPQKHSAEIAQKGGGVDEFGVVQNLEAPAAAQQPGQNVVIPGDPNISRLINDLADFNKQVAVSDELKRFGAAALPQLNVAAQTHPDAEVKIRCRTIIKAINEPPAQQVAQNPLGGMQGMQGLLGGGGALGGGGGDMNAMLMQLLGGGGGGGALGALGGGGGGDMNGMLMQLLGGGGGGALGALGGGGGGDMNGMLMQLLGGGGGGGLLGGQMQQMQQLNAILGGMDGGAGPMPNPPPAVKPAEFTIDLTNNFGARLGEADGGLRVIEVKPGSPAEKGGVKPGDLITKINGAEIAKRDDIVNVLIKADHGKMLKVEVTRRGDALTLDVAN